MMQNIVKSLYPIRTFVAGFAVTGYIFLTLPITKEMKEESKYYHPEKHHH
eukprot:m.19928 g.19928  ORF g.19928 m.19928 type:complete len:50 (+) comp8517_c0_seq1:112-261(+)